MNTLLDSILTKLLDIFLPRPEEIRRIESLPPLGFISKAKRSNVELSSNFPIYSLFSYQDPLVKLAIKEIKYKKNRKIARLFGEILCLKLDEELEDEVLYTHFIDPIIIPVPTHRRKVKKKGFNQTELVLEEFEKIIAEDYSLSNKYEVIKALEKIRETKDQVSQQRKERLVNVTNCFVVKEKYKQYLNYRNVLIFDDVVTTGGTLVEAERALKKAGARRVIGFTLAH